MGPVPAGPALVTGASRGLGRAVALELARRGFDVTATMRDPVAGADLPGSATGWPGSIAIERLDVTDPRTLAVPAGLRVLVNNAGVEPGTAALEHTTDRRWREVFETNVFGLVDVTRRALPSLRRAGGGVIGNLTTLGLVVPMPFYAVYRASKAAVQALSESLRAEVAPFGIRVVEVLPGPIDTDMLAGATVHSGGDESSPYEPLARHVAALQRATTAHPTPVDGAARSIVDALTADDPPARVGCDPVADEMLATWATTDDAEHQAGFLRAFEL